MKFLPKLLAARQSFTRTVTVSCLLSRSGLIVLNWYLCSETVNFSLVFHRRLHRFYIATFFILFLIFICIIVHSICRSIRRFNRPLYSLNFSLEFFIASTIWVGLDIFIFRIFARDSD